ncbi:MAG: type II secretion system F family protein, partial [Phycisphaeraceae bacterium]
MTALLRILGMVVSAVFWLIAGGLALVLVTVLISIISAFTPLMSYASPFVALFALIITAKAWNRVRRARAASVLSYIEQAVRLNLPLPAMLDAAAASERPGCARMLRRVAEAVRSGESIDAAVARHVRSIPDRAVEILRGAVEVGRLPAALTGLVDEQRQTDTSQPEDILAWAYGLVTVTAMLWMLGIVTVYIVPMFYEIFEDFGATLPWMTRVTFAFAQATHYWLMLAALLLGLALAGRAVWAFLHGGERRPRPWRGLFDPLLWRLPVAGGIARDRGLADACGLIAEGMRSGKPMDGAVEAASRLDVNLVLRRRLVRFADALRAGAPLDAAARRAKLPSLVVQMLAAGQATA